MNTKKEFYKLILEFLSISLLVIIVPLAMYIDIVMLKNNMGELSITEFLQSLFILSSALFFIFVIRKDINSKGAYILISGLFLSMFIRESDFYLDVIVHGFWKVPVLITLIITAFYANKNKDTIMAPIVKHAKNKPFTFIMIGLIIVLIFSRIYGTGSLWENIMTDSYNSMYKAVIQESLELFGYIFILLGSYMQSKIRE